MAAYAPPRTFSVSFADIGTLHVIEEGELALAIDGNPHVERVSRGDVILLPRGDPHQVSGAGGRATLPGGGSEHDAPGPEPVRWLCGTFIGDSQASHPLASLPAVIILRGARSPALEGLEVAATYLAHVRLDAATGLLRDTSLPVTLIAENVGYTPEAAFSRAFKHRYGMPPARWRRGRPTPHVPAEAVAP